jgi:hypothetical protein
MNFDQCEYYERRLQRIDELIRHVEVCSIRLRRIRRVISRSKTSSFNDACSNKRQRRRSTTFENVIRENETFDSTNETSVFRSNVININEQLSELLDISVSDSRSSILSISFFIRIRTYKEETNRKIETIIDEELNEKNSESRIDLND